MQLFYYPNKARKSMHLFTDFLLFLPIKLEDFLLKLSPLLEFYYLSLPAR